MMRYGFIFVISEFSLNIKISFIYRTSSICDRNKIIQFDSIFLASKQQQHQHQQHSSSSKATIRMYDVRLYILHDIDWIFAARSRMHSATGDRSQEQDASTCTGSSDAVTENKIKPRSRWAYKLISYTLK